MNSFKLTTFIALTASTMSSHSAVHLSSTDTGSAIIVPFYTVSNQMNTLLSLDNTTDDNKAVKIHFKEAKSGDILTSFNVYLAAQDMWTMGMGQVPSTEGGRLRMVSNDQSCTVGFPNNVDIAIDEDWLWENGTIEIIEMGTLSPTEAPLVHRSCESINQMWQTDQIWTTDSEDQMSAATGGLHAEVTLMDVEQGHSANIPVIHLDGFYGEDNLQHTAVGEETPNLSTGTKDSLVLVNGQVIQTTWPTGYEAVSALLMKTTLTNEFNLEPAVAAQTEWIVSLPTLHYHLADGNETTKPFITSMPNDNGFWFPTRYGYVSYFDREGQIKHHLPCGGCSPQPPEIPINSVVDLVIYHDTDSLISVTPSFRPTPMLSSVFNDNTHYLNASNTSEVASDGWLFDSGKIKLDLNIGPSSFNDRGFNSSDSETIHKYHGLPAFGFVYTKFSNANAQPGLLAQYAFVREHFGEKQVVIGDSQ